MPEAGESSLPFELQIILTIAFRAYVFIFSKSGTGFGTGVTIGSGAGGGISTTGFTTAFAFGFVGGVVVAFGFATIFSVVVAILTVVVATGSAGIAGTGVSGACTPKSDPIRKNIKMIARRMSDMRVL